MERGGEGPGQRAHVLDEAAEEDARGEDVYETEERQLCLVEGTVSNDCLPRTTYPFPKLW